MGSPHGKNYTQAIKAVWDLAAEAFGRLGKGEDQKRCQRESVLQDLKMREQVDSVIARAHWTRVAIGQLRHFGGFTDWVEDLRRELRHLEEASLDEFIPQEMKLDVGELVHGTIAVFETLTLPDILLQFALLAQPASKEKLRRDADESAQKYVLSSLFGASYTDREGKVIAQTGVRPANGEPDEDWYKAQSLLHLEILRRHVAAGRIEPARQTVADHFALEQRHFIPIVQHSAFVPPGYEHVFSLGFARFWQGDYASAAHLLIPQLENSIRHLLASANAHSAKMMSDLTQDDRSLSGLILHMRSEIEAIFHADLTNELDMLFNFRPGPALRHAVAHGKLSDGHCYGPDTIYGCWLIYHLTCLPLVSHWRELIAPAIEAQAF